MGLHLCLLMLLVGAMLNEAASELPIPHQILQKQMDLVIPPRILRGKINSSIKGDGSKSEDGIGPSETQAHISRSAVKRGTVASDTQAPVFTVELRNKMNRATQIPTLAAGRDGDGIKMSTKTSPPQATVFNFTSKPVKSGMPPKFTNVSAKANLHKGVNDTTLASAYRTPLRALLNSGGIHALTTSQRSPKGNEFEVADRDTKFKISKHKAEYDHSIIANDHEAHGETEYAGKSNLAPDQKATSPSDARPLAAASRVPVLGGGGRGRQRSAERPLHADRESRQGPSHDPTLHWSQLISDFLKYQRRFRGRTRKGSRMNGGGRLGRRHEEPNGKARRQLGGPGGYAVVSRALLRRREHEASWDRTALSRQASRKIGLVNRRALQEDGKARKKGREARKGRNGCFGLKIDRIGTSTRLGC
uniref:Uncharacterized protein LOC116947124 n=1 Tax=Petromyzon marinus TaxID=7757 RepID=A0AAJ7X234_PETMA|nr:uncharacterized protein LOC116947124 [Petromyzon marinus]